MNHKLIQVFQTEVEKIRNDPDITDSTTAKNTLKELVHQLMLNEYGFDYLLKMEFNGDIFDTFQSLNAIALNVESSDV